MNTPQWEDFFKNRRFFEAINIVRNHRTALGYIIWNTIFTDSLEKKDTYAILDHIYELAKNYAWIVDWIISEEIILDGSIQEKKWHSQLLRSEEAWLRGAFRDIQGVDAGLVIELQCLIEKTLKACRLESLGLFSRENM